MYNLNVMNIFALTFGCKVNQYESYAMLELLSSSGFNVVKNMSKADIIIINSCTVTSKSDQKLRQTVNRIRRENKNVIIVLVGCMPQAFPETSKSILGLDIILGNCERKYIKTAICKFLVERKKFFKVDEHSKFSQFENISVSNFQTKTRAFLKIEDGCNQFCSYCIIPFARGRVRSRSIKDIVLQTKNLALKGYKEIIIVGINLSAYGKDFNLNLSDAIEAVCSVEGVERVRLGSLEPKIITDSFLKKISNQLKVCPQFHLSLQSGCNKTLKSMNRNYTTLEYENIVKNLRSAYDNPAITTDLLVGFPGESDEDFNETKEFVEKIKFSKAHIFKYSKRPKTKSYELKDNVDPYIKNKRSKEIFNIVRRTSKEFVSSQIEKKDSVLFESIFKDGFSEGYSSKFVKVRVFSKSLLCGKILNVVLKDFKEEKNSYVFYAEVFDDKCG
ncbi:MAG: tRNA (N(6)-L-threonylcarbamoyladenosine(37)-C(2))-methylthiotransferase MtaB [Oscillospiraceae bacterium]|nr:tRNA (N(6)-L-threonylcarbamoyladenosine(37)-C(2))-methylthiotransferase MtaB [Oscillospiraceae bacterium]